MTIGSMTKKVLMFHNSSWYKIKTCMNGQKRVECLSRIELKMLSSHVKFAHLLHFLGQSPLLFTPKIQLCPKKAF